MIDRQAKVDYNESNVFSDEKGDCGGGVEWVIFYLINYFWSFVKHTDIPISTRVLKKEQHEKKSTDLGRFQTFSLAVGRISLLKYQAKSFRANDGKHDGSDKRIEKLVAITIINDVRKWVLDGFLKTRVKLESAPAMIKSVEATSRRTTVTRISRQVTSGLL